MPVATTTDETDWEVEACGLPPGKRDWAPLRALAQTRARITLKQVWEDAATDKRIYQAQFHRFCYRDYGPSTLSVIETPIGISFSFSEREKGETIRRQKGYYSVSFRGGRLAFYMRRKTGPTTVAIFHALPFNLDITSTVRDSYPAAKQRFAKRLIKMLRSKARANGVRLPTEDYTDLPTLLTDALFPALKSVKEQYKALKASEWTPGKEDRWLLRHMRCPADQLVKRMTGYNSRVVKRLFWEAMKQTSTEGPAERAWEHKWSWTALLRTWLPVDYTQALLRAPQVATWESSLTDDPAKVRRFLKQWTPAQVLRALTQTATDSGVIRDTIHLLKQHGEQAGAEPVPRTNGPKELHDWLSAARNRRFQREAARRDEERRQREQERLAAMTPEERAAVEARQAAEREREEKERAEELLPLPVEYGKDVDGKVVITPDGTVHTILLPHTPEQLSEWGAAMHNCIGSYARWIRQGRLQIFGVRTEPKEGEKCRAVDWGIEVRHGEIGQFRGVCNQDAPADLRMAVEAALREAKLLGDEPAALAGALAVAGEDAF